MKHITILIAAGLLGGCTTLEGVKQHAGDAYGDLIDSHCSLPKTARIVLRVEAAQASEGKGVLVIGCAGEPDYDAIRTAFVEPLSDQTIQAILVQVLEQGRYTLPDGRTVRLQVDDPPEE